MAFIVRDTVFNHTTVTASFPFSYSSFELAQLTVTSPQLVHFFCLYSPPPSKKNRLTESAFFSEFCYFLEHCSLLRSKVLIAGDFNFHFDSPTNFNIVHIIDILQTFRFSQAVSVPTHSCGHTLDLVVHRDEDSLLRSFIVSLP